MNEIDSLRKSLNKQQTELGRALKSTHPPEDAIGHFLNHHAMLHSARMAQLDTWSFEDAVLCDLTEEQFRRIPHNCEHSIVWCIWHMARIEDVAMNLLVAGSSQVLKQNKWFTRMKAKACDTGNEWSDDDMADLSATIDIDALKAYRVAVGRRTRVIVGQLKLDDLKRRVDPHRLQTARDKGVVTEKAGWLLDYWSKRNIAGLLLMPATRHNIVHLNEALKLKQRRR